MARSLIACADPITRDVHAIDHTLAETWRGYLVAKLESSPALTG